MKSLILLLIVLIIAVSGCKPKEGPVVVNDFSCSIEIDAVFADGHIVKGILDRGRTGWLCHEESELVALTVSVEGREVISVEEERLRRWRNGLSDKQVLVVTVSEKGARGEGQAL